MMVITVIMIFSYSEKWEGRKYSEVVDNTYHALISTQEKVCKARRCDRIPSAVKTA